MNQMNEPRDDRPGEGQDLSEASAAGQQPLRAIEQQLRRFRPRPPRLDLAEITRLASAPVPGDGAMQPRAPSETADELGTASRAPRRSVRTYGGLAAVWLCGVAAGALTMFLADHRSLPTALPRDPGGGLVRQPADDAAAAVALTSDAGTMESETRNSVAGQRQPRAIRDPLPAAGAVALEHDLRVFDQAAPRRRPLRVGAFLRGVAGQPTGTSELSATHAASVNTGRSRPRSALPPSFSDSFTTPAVTRDALLRALRDELPELTL